MKQIKLTVHGREETGRRASRRLRRTGNVPAVLYGKHCDPVSLLVEKPEVLRLLKETAGAASLVELAREGDSPRLSIVSEVQRNPMTDSIVHIDFHEVSAKETLDTQVIVHLDGESFGVKNQDGVLDVILHQVEIRCLPKNLPEFINVDISGLKVGEAVHIRDLPRLEGVEYLGAGDQVIVSCTEQRTAVKAATEEAEVAADEAAKPAAE